MKLTSRRFGQVVFLVIGLAGTILFQNCGVQRPAMEDMSFASVGFTHTGQETSCAQCHSGSRPNSVVGLLGVDPAVPFDYSSHGAGLDCVECHNPVTGVPTRVNWAGAFYRHSGTLTTCAQCHATERPDQLGYSAAAVGFDHAKDGTGDCFGCHQTALTSKFISLLPIPGGDWSGAGAPAELLYDPARDYNRPGQVVTAYIPTYSGTSIVSVTQQTTQPMHQPMNHSTTQVPAATLSNCNLCHTQLVSSANYRPGVFHTSVPISPTACGECHGVTQPDGFVGALDNKRSPVSKNMKHDAVAWSGSPLTPSKSSILLNDCSQCHKQPGIKWVGAQFHASLITQPSSCLDCHANSRTIGNVATLAAVATGPQFDHKNGGMGECVTCHASTSTWANGKLHALGTITPATCVSCHNSERPNLANGADLTLKKPNAPFDYVTHGGTMDCTSCHKGINKFTAKTDWGNGDFVHTAALTSCSNCHMSQRPDKAGITAALIGFDHAKDGTGDCIGCHKATLTAGTTNPITVFFNKFNIAYPGAFAKGGDWANGASYPTGLVGSKTLKVNTTSLVSSGGRVTSGVVQAETLIEQFLHTSAGIPATAAPGNPPDPTKCSICHLATGYAGGLFHSKIATQPTANCQDCHMATQPMNISQPAASGFLKPMDHDALFSDGTGVKNISCASCHKSPGNVWSDGTFHANIGAKAPTDCTLCHFVTLTGIAPTQTINRMDHTSLQAPQNCSACHAATKVAPAVAATWSGTKLHTNIKTGITQCTECHLANERKDGFTANFVKAAYSAGKSPVNATIINKYTHTAGFGGNADCAVCHKANLGVLWSGGIYNHTSNGTAQITASCNSCHTVDSTSVFAGTATAFKDAFIHSTNYVASADDCVTCHLAASTTTPLWSGAKWSKGSRGNHKTVGGALVTTCLPCHSEKDHKQGQECASCHGTGKRGTTGGSWN